LSEQAQSSGVDYDESVDLEAQALEADAASQSAAGIKRLNLFQRLLRHRMVVFGGVIMALMLLIAAIAPYLGTVDPAYIDPTNRNKKPGYETTVTDDNNQEIQRTYWMGTDALGRDIYSRVIYGTQISLIVGLVVAVLSIVVGTTIGMVSGYIRWLDGIIMRIMDGLMAIPGILLAIGLVSLSGATIGTVIVAIMVPEIPRVVRLVRSIVLSIREEPYVEAAISVGTPLPLILIRHVLPNTVAPLIVQGTYVCASAILVEAILSFLGAGISPETPTWGNIMAEGRVFFRVYPHNILFPGIFLAFTVLAVNVLGDGLRDTLDPRMAKRL
jgi:peptide/nickel transport system permease protein